MFAARWRVLGVDAAAFVVELVVVALDDVVGDGLAAVEARVPVALVVDAEVWLCDAAAWLAEAVPVVVPVVVLLVVPAFAADAMVWPEAAPDPTDAEAFFGVLDPPHAVSPIVAVRAITNARDVRAKPARRER